MQSTGPFKVYNHAEAKGPKEYVNSKIINEQAVDRFNQEIEELKNMKEFQKNQFLTSKQAADMLFNLKSSYKNQV